MSEKELLLKIIATREYLLKSGKGLKPEPQVKAALSPFKKWIKFFGEENIKDQGCKAMMLLNWDTLMVLIPGKGSKAHESLLTQCLKLKG